MRWTSLEEEEQLRTGRKMANLIRKTLQMIAQLGRRRTEEVNSIGSISSPQPEGINYGCDGCFQGIKEGSLRYNCNDCMTSFDLCETCYNGEPGRLHKEMYGYLHEFTCETRNNYVISQEVKESNTLEETISKMFKCYADRHAIGTYSSTRHQYEYIRFKELEQFVSSFVSALHQVMTAEHTRMVALCSVVRLEWYIADFACTLLGIPTVGITASSDKETSGYILNQTETSIVVCSWEHLDMFMSLANKECPNIREIVVMDLNENENVLIVKPITSQRLRIWQFTEFLAVGAKDLIDYTQFRTDPKELFTICYTSGSTGQPKGCVFSRELWLRQILIPTNFGILGIKRIWFSFQPPSHMMEREAFHLTLASGCKAGIYRGSMEYLFEDIRMVRPTVVTSTPRFFSIIYNQFLQGIYDEYRKYLLDNKLDDESSLLPANLLEASNSVFKSGASKVPFEVKEKVKEKFKDYLGGREKVIGVGGAAVSPELKKFLSFCFDALVQEGYGTTEVGGITNGDWYSHDVTIRLRDVPEMGYLTTDDPPRGEICVKTNHMISGYYKNLEKTQEKFQDGYFCTGDIGVMESAGHLRIIDRKKNIFKLAQGEFVVPERLELIYEANSSLVEQCYIHGNIYQNQVVAVIVPHKEALMEVLEQEELLDQEFANDVRVMCGSTKIKEIILKELRSVGDTHKLHGWEIPLGVVLEPHPFTEANNLLTSTLKKRRLQLEQKYKDELEELYVTAAAQGVSLLENMSDMQILSIEERILICLLDVLIKKGFEVASSKYLSDSSLGHQLDLNLTLTQLGGDSLTAMRLSNAIEDQASVSIPAVAILNQPLTSVFELVISKLQPSPSPSDALPSQDEPVKKIDWDKEISIQFLHISSSAVKLSPTSSYTTKDNNNSVVVLLTGCSGFLGKFILWELIKSKNSIQVYCIIRRYEGHSIEDRLATILEELMSELPGEVDPAVIKEKCVPIEGDLSKPLLGLSQTDYNFLSNEVNVVIHNGANVNHILNYHDLKATNVRSTKEIIKFCCQGNPKFLHYVSSLGVFLVNPMEKVNENTNPDQKWLDRLNGYSQSKWVSEKLILNAISDGFIRGNISRPGLIGANSKTGHCNKTDWFYQLVRSLHQLGYYPTGPSWDNGGVSIVTVDTVARAVVHLSLGYLRQMASERSKLSVFHLNCPKNVVTFKSIIESLKKVGSDTIIQPLDEATFMEMLTQRAKGMESVSISTSHVLLSSNNCLLTPPVTAICSDETIRILNKAGIMLNISLEDYMDKYIHYIKFKGLL